MTTVSWTAVQAEIVADALGEVIAQSRVRSGFVVFPESKLRVLVSALAALESARAICKPRGEATR